MVGWHHQLKGHEFKQILGDSEGQRSLVCCSSWGHKESDTIERLHFHFLRNELNQSKSKQGGEEKENDT